MFVRVHRLSAVVIMRVVWDNRRRNNDQPNESFYTKPFYICDEKFVFYSRMECWLWLNILIEMIANDVCVCVCVYVCGRTRILLKQKCKHT